MNKIIGLAALGLLASVGTANALPIFSHTQDSSGLFTVSVDGTNETTDFYGLYIDDVTNATAIGSDLGTNYLNAGYFAISDNNADDLIEFSFMNTNNLSELTGTVFYSNSMGESAFESFAYNLSSQNPTPPQPEPAPPLSVPEPSTFLLIGFGLLGIAGTRLIKARRYS